MKFNLTIFAASLLLGLAPAQAQNFAAMRKAEAQPTFPAPAVTLQGFMVSNDNWTSDADAGIYSIEARPGGAITCIHRSPAMINTAAAVRKDNVVYAVEASPAGIFYVTYSANDWTTSGSRQEIDDVNLPSDLTYDPVTAKAYGGFWDAEEQYYSRFASFGLTTAEARDINYPNRDIRDIYAIAADGKGTIYALWGGFNYLATFNPRNGEAVRIGTTGLSPEVNNVLGHVSSMCYDEANGRLLASVYQEDGYGANKKCWSGLYEINTATGKATKIMDFDGNACFAGLYVADDRADENAPAAPRNLAVTFGESALAGTVSFDVPTASVGGAPLSGELMALVSVNGNEKLLTALNPGQHVDVTGMDFVEGNNEVKVIMADATRRGDSAELTVWAGEDVPTAVSGLTLAVNNGTATLSWTAPAYGQNGGALSAASLRYEIKRYPDGKVVADAATGSTFTDSSIDPSWKALYYTVKAYNGKGTAEAVASNKCPAAGAFSVPFAENFDTADDFDVWTVINVNGGSTWTWDKSGKRAQYKYHEENLAGDDWLVTPPIALEEGTTYKLTYTYSAYNARYAESFEVMLGTVPTVEGLDKRLAAHEDFVNTTAERGAVAFTAASTGKHYIGFHNYSAPKMWSMYLDAITLEAIDSRVPASVADLTVTPAAQGALKAIVAFTAPANDTEGKALTMPMTITVRRGDDLVKTLESVAPGAECTVDDDAVPAAGTYTYSVTCSNDLGDNVPASMQTYVGVDAPGAVGDLSLTEVDRHAVLSWSAPVAGSRGGWFDADAVTYRIVRSDGTVVAEAFDGTVYTDKTYTAPAASQDAIWYLVTPYCGDLKGAYAQTELTLFGQPYKPDSAETFAGADMCFYPWIAQSDNAVNYAWTLDTAGNSPATADQSGDRGLATFHVVGEPAGTVSWFYSPMFDLSTLAKPALTFWMYHSPSVAGDASIEVYVSDGGEFAPAGAVFGRTDAEADGWVRHSVALDGLASTGRVRVAFKGTGDAAANIFLDNIAFATPLDIDLAVTALSAPARIGAGVAAEFEVKVLNAGVKAAEGAKVVLTGNGGVELAKADVPALAAGEMADVALSCVFDATGSVSVTATATIAGDEDAANNSASATVKVVEPVIPRPVDLSAVTDGSLVILSWKAPSEQPVVTDDVEAYNPWAIDGIGEWSMFDGDYDLTYYINKDAGEYENAYARKAFQVLDVNLLGINIWDEGKAHSGKRLFAALAGINYVNDDWLISPRLNGAEQWISFYARSFTTQDVAPERMRVWYSTTDTDPVNFIELTSNYVELDGTWREYRYFLPAGARYFAVNCVSDGSFAMFVDDLSFNDLSVPAWRVTGYEVFRNGEKIGETGELYFLDTAEGKATYTVRALYGSHGTSEFTDPAEVELSSLTAPATGAEVEAAYTPDGLEADPSALVPGVYILRYTDGTVRKTVVR